MSANPILSSDFDSLTASQNVLPHYFIGTDNFYLFSVLCNLALYAPLQSIGIYLLDIPFSFPFEIQCIGLVGNRFSPCSNCSWSYLTSIYEGLKHIRLRRSYRLEPFSLQQQRRDLPDISVMLPEFLAVNQKSILGPHLNTHQTHPKCRYLLVFHC